MIFTSRKGTRRLTNRKLFDLRSVIGRVDLPLKHSRVLIANGTEGAGGVPTAA